MVWVYLAIAIGCSQIPLLDVLGYESSFVFGIVSGLIVLLTIEHPYKDEPFVRWWMGEVYNQILPLLAPIGVFVLNSFVVQNCDWLGGLQFWVVIPMMTVVIVSGMIGVVSQFISNRIRTVVFLLLI